MRDTINKYLPAAATGVVLALCFPTFSLFPLVWVALVPLLWRTWDLSPRQAAPHFFVAGFLFHAVLLQWLLSNIMWAGGWAVIGQQLMCVVLSLFWVLAGVAWTWFRTRIPAWAAPVTLGMIWMCMEQLQGTTFTGFGWSALAYSQGKDLPLLQWAAIGTAPIISFFIVTFNALIVQAITNKPRRFRALAWAAGLLLGAHGIGALLIGTPDYASPPLSVGVFQSNFSLEMKWDNEYTVEMVKNAAEKSVILDGYANVDLMIWPEALVTSDIESPAIYGAITDATTLGNFAVFTGAARWEDGRAYNSSYLIDTDGAILDHYDKIHLAPFGEYVPLADLLPFVSQIVPSIGNIATGTEAKVLPVRDRGLGPLICFEVLFPPMAQQLRENDADFLVVITNLAWFGHSNAIPQELDIARVRAIETRLPLVHAANTGISGIFDPWGRFQMVDTIPGPRDSILQLREGVKPKDIVMHRAAGVFDLPEPAMRPVPIRADYFPWLVLAATLILMVTSAFIDLTSFQFRKPKPPEEAPTDPPEEPPA